MPKTDIKAIRILSLRSEKSFSFGIGIDKNETQIPVLFIYGLGPSNLSTKSDKQHETYADIDGTPKNMAHEYQIPVGIYCYFVSDFE